MAIKLTLLVQRAEFRHLNWKQWLMIDRCKTTELTAAGLSVSACYSDLRYTKQQTGGIEISEKKEYLMQQIPPSLGKGKSGDSAAVRSDFGPTSLPPSAGPRTQVI